MQTLTENPRIRSLVQTFKNSKKFAIGTILFVTLCLIALFSQVIIPYNPKNIGQFPMALPPSFEHPLGTDAFGRDVFTQLIWGIQSSMIIGLLAGGISTLIGVSVGLLAGYKRGKVDSVLMTINNIFLTVPSWPLLIVISAYIRDVTPVHIATILAIFGWAWGARTIRAQVISLREREFISFARLSGQNDVEIAFKEVLTQIPSFIGVTLANSISYSILAEVSLEIVGITPSNVSTLGMMLHWAVNTGALIRGMWWWIFSPIAILTLLFVALHSINMGLDELYNPKLRRSK